MIFGCPNCAADCPIPDERLRNRILKVRCTHCRHVFYVKDPALEEQITQSLQAPPPPDEDDIWFYAKDKQTHGPVSIGAMRRLLENTQLLASTLVWKEGMEQWRPLGEVRELTDILQAIASPPPPPSAPIAPGLDEAVGAEPEPDPMASMLEISETELAVDLDQAVDLEQAVEPAVGHSDDEIAASLIEEEERLRREQEEAALQREIEREEARKKEEAEAKKKADEEARKKEETEAKKKADEEARKKEEAEAKKKADEEARKKEEAEAKKKADEEARKKEEAEAKKKADEEARKKEEAEAKKKADEEARKKEEAEAKKKADEEARKKEEAEAKKKADEEARKKEEAEAKKKAAAVPVTDSTLTVETEKAATTRPTKPILKALILLAILASMATGVIFGLLLDSPTREQELLAPVVEEESTNLFLPDKELPKTTENTNTTKHPVDDEKTLKKKLDAEVKAMHKALTENGKPKRKAQRNGNGRPAPSSNGSQPRESAIAMPTVPPPDIGENPFLPSGLSQSQIKTVIERNLTRIRFCYDSQLRRNPNLSGKVVVSFTINGNGRVSTVKLKTRKFRGSYLDSCVSEAIRGWSFPKFSGDPISVDYPFIFSSY